MNILKVFRIGHMLFSLLTGLALMTACTPAADNPLIIRSSPIGSIPKDGLVFGYPEPSPDRRYITSRYQTVNSTSRNIFEFDTLTNKAGNPRPVEGM